MSYKRHPDYKVSSKYHDIGLIELIEPNYTFRPICLPSAANSKSHDKNYSIAGWSLLIYQRVIYKIICVLVLVFNIKFFLGIR